MHTRTRALRSLTLVAALGLLAAACGGDDETTSPATSGGSESSAATTAATGGATTTRATGGATTSAATGGAAAALPEACTPDPALDATAGIGAGTFIANVKCASETPLKAEGEPIVIGMQNPQGDPAGSFPEYTASIEAATKYINEELGGLGSNPSEGTPGRPIQLETCFMAINPADSQKCANELAGKDPFAVISTVNFFGNHFPIYQAAGVNVLVSTPITIADFTSPGVFSVGAGGGCLGVHTGLVYAATQELGAKKVAVPWSDTPPGVVCYYDLEKKPLDVLQGAVQGESELAGTITDLQQVGVPIKPASADVTPQATQVLDFDPDAILFSAQGADCWNLVDAMGRLGWTPDQTPLVLSDACVDFEKMRAAGDLAEGVYFVGSPSAILPNPDAIEDPRLKFEAETYLDKAKEYGVSDGDLTKGFAGSGWSVMMNLWEQSNIIVADGTQLTPATFKAHMEATDGNHLFASLPFGCASAPEPYTAVCSSEVTLVQWDGDTMNVVNPRFSGIDLVAGTELKPGP